MQSPDKLLRAYLASIENKDIDSIRGPQLVENPFLKPPRLVGDKEIELAHRQIFASLTSIKFELDTVMSCDTHAIAEGRLEVTRFEKNSEYYQIGVTAEADENGLQRISIYADTRNIRRWLDQTIQ